ncbi:MAG: hypothetical protein OMM_00979 [Candidatus Magnetoglobus multicellularis str. Araruama]|uniref:Uncharacterized protein n=1 Tax=Candidatus Magnetoglobus multicellularis str. Araruama TaxID=890399 RepID=A0A1V1PES1_9BACT|nr:MAG: hypothetical protein OMM_00979 [Candidatus Magnetoglobus multicellularis str. Araruama]
MHNPSSKPVIMIVDDSTVNLFLLEAQLKNEYEIITAINGSEAINKAKSSPKPDIILLDIIMPDMDGYTVCSILKKESNTASIPIIFITSVDEADKETYGLQLGAADYITRPFNIEIVKSRINVHLDLKKNRDALESAILQLREKETYLETIMTTIQNGVIISDPESHSIIDVNPFFCDMMGTCREDLLGKDFREYLGSGEIFGSDDSQVTDYRDHSLLKTSGSEIIHTRRWFKTARLGRKDILVQSLSDITNIKELIKQQDINIIQAKQVMKIIHNRPERNISLNNHTNLFIGCCTYPSHKEGGDHLFVKSVPSGSVGKKDKTFMSIKDQSGHKVGCILRSISTDLIHNAIIHQNPSMPLEQMVTLLNKNILKSKVFSLEEYFTSINIMIDHETSKLHFVSSAHPPFFLIRDQKVSIIGKPGEAGTNLPIPMPDYQFEKGEHCLLPNDRYILFTDGMTDIALKSGAHPLTMTEMQQRLENCVKSGHQYITEIMSDFMEWISEKSNGLFQPRIQPDNSDSALINQTGDDITVLWFEIESTDPTIERKLQPNTIEDIDDFTNRFHDEVMTTCKSRGYKISPHMFRTALIEMLLNAWKHGNIEDPTKTISIRIRFANDIHLEVIDQGSGFDYSNLPDPTEGDNILKASGRGIFMTRYAANEVFWKDDGRHIVSVFKREFDPLNNEVAYHNDIHLW